MTGPLAPLPVDAVLPALQECLRRDRSAVLVAPPGSGKTTRVPSAILDLVAADAAVVVLQPRRMAARAAARRVASELSVDIPDLVGYQVRHEDQTGPTTRIRFVTEGVLLRQILADPSLPRVGAVVLDEFHERHLESDLSLAMLSEVRSTLRDDLLLLVMSATLDPQPLLEYLAPSALIETAGRQFEVVTTHVPPARTATRRGTHQHAAELAGHVRVVVMRALQETTGDVLVFLPGVREIDACMRAMQRTDCEVLPLHGKLDAADQDRVLAAGGPRRIVLATNIAESSLTLPRVTAVVDSGLVRRLRQDRGTGLDRLGLETISLASARQRTGRAGRVTAGRCYRLWSAAEEKGMAVTDPPELARLDLSGPALMVRAFAGRAHARFEWYQAPEPASWSQASELLNQLGALDDSGALNRIGTAMAALPLHPRLARVMVEARQRGCAGLAATACALLSEMTRPASGDLRDLLAAFERRRLDPATLASVRLARQQILRIVGAARDQHGDDPADLGSSVLVGFPDRVGKRSDNRAEAVLASGRGVRLEMEDHENLGQLFVALRMTEVGATQYRRARVELALPIEMEWLTVLGSVLVEEDAAELAADGCTVVRVQRTRVGALVLRERTGGPTDPDQVRALLAPKVCSDPWRWIGAQPRLRAFLERLRWLRRAQLDSESPLPEVGDAELSVAILSVFDGSSGLERLPQMDLLPILTGTLNGDVAARVERLAPPRIALPGGRQAEIDYSGETPGVSARIQELFGCTTTPRVGGGRIPLVLSILGPNLRPIQVTADLASFWANIYPKARLELKRRYPKHSWPEDPLRATPESGPQRRPRPNRG